MRDFLYEYYKPKLDEVNEPIMSGEYDSDIIEYIVDICKSLQIIPQVTYLSYEYQPYADKINDYAYIDAKMRDSMKSKNKATKYKSMNKSRYAEMKLKFKVEFDGDVRYPVVKILIPVPDKFGYYLINGNRCMLMYQIVDNSTYVIKKSVVLKTMTKLAISTDDVPMTYFDGDDNTIHETTEIIYTIEMGETKATQKINLMLFLFAKFGYESAIDFLSMRHVIEVIDNMETLTPEPGYIYVKGKGKGKKVLGVKVNKMMFQKFRYVRAIANMISSLLTRKVTTENINEVEFWYKTIGELYTPNINTQVRKGYSSLPFIERMLDDTTKKVVKANKVNLSDSFSAIRWVLMNFAELKKKSNFDIKYKRLRRNELIASLVRYEFGSRANKILAKPDKVDMKTLLDVFKIPSDTISSSLRKSGLLKYDERVNDMDIWDRLRITSKGPNTMGTSMKRTIGKPKRRKSHISKKYRTIDPSFIGYIDISVCGTSDPGTTLYLTSNNNMDSLYFGDGKEPESGMYNIEKARHDYYVQQGYTVVDGDMSCEENFYKYREYVHDMVSGISMYIKEPDPLIMYGEIPEEHRFPPMGDIDITRYLEHMNDIEEDDDGEDDGDDSE